MINLPVDEAYAFDYLAILEIKKSWDTHNLVWKAIVAQIGQKQCLEVIRSPEYKRVVDVNKVVFDNVDKAKTDGISASELDRSNYERYKAKIALQHKFFTTALTEKKI